MNDSDSDPPMNAPELLEACAIIAERIGNEFHDGAPDPQEDSSDLAGEEIAKALRELDKLESLERHEGEDVTGWSKRLLEEVRSRPSFLTG